MRGWISSPSYRHVATVIASTRAASGLSQRELARRLNTHPSVVAKIETGQRRLDVLEFIDIAHALGVEPDGLLARITSAPSE